jgi:hypothetical protein
VLEPVSGGIFFYKTDFIMLKSIAIMTVVSGASGYIYNTFVDCTGAQISHRNPGATGYQCYEFQFSTSTLNTSWVRVRV